MTDRIRNTEKRKEALDLLNDGDEDGDGEEIVPMGRASLSQRTSGGKLHTDLQLVFIL
jgi:hypothetical protein